MIGTIGTYLILREDHGYALLRDRSGPVTRYTVVGFDQPNYTVSSAIPADCVKGCHYFAPATTRGVDYVAGWYSRSWAYSEFRRLTDEVTR